MSNDALSNCAFVQLNYLQSQEVRNQRQMNDYTALPFILILCSFFSSPLFPSRLLFFSPLQRNSDKCICERDKNGSLKKKKKNHVQISFTGEAGKKLIHSKSTISNSYKNIFSPNTIQMVVSSQFHHLSSLIILFVV